MSWKNWPYWLKGGLKGLGIGIILSLIPIVTVWVDLGGAEKNLRLLDILSWIMIFLAAPSLLILNFISSGTFSLPGSGDMTLLGLFMYSLVIVPIEFFIFGAIIGLIIGKRKSKKSNPEEKILSS